MIPYGGSPIVNYGDSYNDVINVTTSKLILRFCYSSGTDSDVDLTSEDGLKKWKLSFYLTGKIHRWMQSRLSSSSCYLKSVVIRRYPKIPPMHTYWWHSGSHNRAISVMFLKKDFLKYTWAYIQESKIVIPLVRWWIYTVEKSVYRKQPKYCTPSWPSEWTRNSHECAERFSQEPFSWPRRFSNFVTKSKNFFFRFLHISPGGQPWSQNHRSASSWNSEISRIPCPWPSQVKDHELKCHILDSWFIITWLCDLDLYWLWPLSTSVSQGTMTKAIRMHSVVWM